MADLTAKNTTTYEATFKEATSDLAQTKVVIGGSDTTKFIPNVNASKWNDECFLNINFGDIAIDKETQTFTDGKAEITVGDVTFFSYALNDTVLEIGVKFGKQPSLSVLKLPLKYTDGLTFYQQPHLSSKEIEDGHNRPENVEGSIAVYWKEKNNQYKTGKFCHLYRWKCTDAKGKEEWCSDLKIENDVLIIELPTDYLKNAEYPVTAMGSGDSIGYSTVGGSNHGTTISIYYCSGTTNASGGNVSTYHAAVAAIGTPADIKLGIYTDSSRPNSRVEQIEMTVSVSDDNQQASSSQSALAGSTKYWVGLLPESNDTKVKYDYTSGMYIKSADSYANEMVATVTGGISSNATFSVWVDYAAGGSTIWKSQRRKFQHLVVR
jgi:hypothetical protein